MYCSGTEGAQPEERDGATRGAGDPGRWLPVRQTMIKKNTKIIIDGKETLDEIGGVPLSKGETVRVHSPAGVEEYVVVEKTVDYLEEDGDSVINIQYRLERK